MIIVADTTPLISLMKIGHLDLLTELFGSVQIPKAVFDELVYNSNFLEESKLIRECKYIQTVAIKDTSAVELLRRSSGLDAGERSTGCQTDGDPFNGNNWLIISWI